MTLHVFLAVIAAAAMHATWNAVIKVNTDRFLSMTLMTVGCALAAAPFALTVGLPTQAMLPWIATSVMFHMGYKLCLIAAYEAGDMAQTYPLARGTAPLLTTIGGIYLVKEIPAPFAIVGIVMLSLGTFLMSFRGGRHLEKLNLRAVGFALATSIFVAGYTLSDGSGARLAETATAYAVWLFLADGVWSLGFYVVRRGTAALPALLAGWRIGAITGVLSAVAYWIAMWAMTKAPIASVAALRETSILFAMMISVVALRETMTAWRGVAALLIVGGVIALRLA